MKRFGIFFIIAILIAVLLWLAATRRVDSTPYFETDYYKQSQMLIDSLQAYAIQTTGPLYAGFSKVSITPKLNQEEENISEGKYKQVPLAGYGDRKGAPSTGVHDSVFVKAAALRSGNETLVFISADLLIIPPDITDSVITLITKEGITREMLFFSATHTHSSLGGWGGGFVGKQFAGKENKNLKKWLALKTATAINNAIDDLKPASCGSGNFEAGEFTRNRLIGDRGTKNNDFSYIYIKQNGHSSAVIGSFSAHATALGEDNMAISADYPGYWARFMEQSTVDYALFFAGAMGSQSPVSKGEGFEKARYLGESLAQLLIQNIDTTELTENPLISYAGLNMPLPGYRFRVALKRTLTTCLSNRLMPAHGNACLQAVRLDKMVWITTPADFSGEYALMIKNRLASKGFNSNVTGFNGNYLGYIIPGRYFYLDKYEPKTMGWFGPFMGDYTMDLIRQLSDIVTENQ